MMYEQTDKIIKYLNKRFIRIFSKAKTLSSFEELNVIKYSQSMYNELERITEKAFLLLAKRVYLENSESEKTDIVVAWLLGVLKAYNPVTKYVYLHEVERKRSRFAESLIASSTKTKEVETALRYWSAMVRQYAIDVTDSAIKQAYIDDGVLKVKWITLDDERMCVECGKRNGNIYDIAKVPPKPHIGCRCYLVPYHGGGG